MLYNDLAVKQLEREMKVFVYFNLHKKLFSVKSLEGPMKGRVVAHRNYVSLDNVTFKVSEAGRRRVLAEQRKNVHAGLVGEWNDTFVTLVDPTPVTYNPYRYDSFVNKNTESRVTTARRAVLDAKTIMAEI
jgi:hypothetical protein